MSSARRPFSTSLAFGALRASLALPARALRALAVAIALVACGARIDQKSFARIETDMPEAEVFAILGEPTDSSSFDLAGLSATSATWEGEGGTIAIQFVNGKVKLKTFASAPPASE